MAKTMVAQIDDGRLGFAPEPSDRFVYSNYYVPLQLTFDDQQTPVLPFYTKQRVLEVEGSGVLTETRVHEVLDELHLDALWDRNRMEEAKGRLGGGVINLHAADNAVVADDGEPEVAVRPTVLGPQDTSFVAGLLRPDIGFAFLDRTRITPIGLALGEHVYSLGLAPGEEIVLDQKNYTKRQSTLEDQTEQERQFDLELASTYTTELQEGFERQRSTTDAWGLNASHTGQYTSPEFFWGKFSASHTIGVTHNVTEADQRTSRWSVKDGQTASSKVAARYRTQHKTTFRVVTEVGFETTSKRTIRNPNRATSLTLNIFKVLQRLRLRQERYGVRLCWAVAVKDPGASFVTKLAKARQAVIDDAVAALPQPPVEPPSPPDTGGTAPTTRPTGTASSEVIVANHWSVTGGMSWDYDVDVAIPAGWGWDGSPGNIQIAVFTKRPDNTVSRWVVGAPYPAENGALRIKTHIGAPEWIGGPGISFQVTVGTYQDVAVSDKAPDDTRYADDLAMYRTALKDWQDRRDTALTEAREAADALVSQLLTQLSPVNEMIGQIVEQHFPPSLRDEMWEIDHWQRLFDWERAAFVAYPAWWSGGATRDPRLDPSDFLNASWAKLYLPVRVDLEHAALRWIFGKSVDQPLPAEVEHSFDAVLADLAAYRLAEFGTVDETPATTKNGEPIEDLHACLGTWEELVPTDGTHIETLLGATSAADPATTQALADETAARAARLADDRQSTRLKDRAADLMRGPIGVRVHVHTGDTGDADPR